ncbi:MAG: hypothetical protein H0X62_03385 [Bacteroidetes bacterium]|nr:hypothetical protein [Bacteroidota bacterium]
MKNFLSLTFLTLIALNAISQNMPAENGLVLPKEKLTVMLGRSLHHSGNLVGPIINTDYSCYFKKKLSLSIGIGATTHHREWINEVEMPNGEIADGSFRMLNSGIQGSTHLGYSFIRNRKNDFQIRIGALARYQSRSNMEISLLYPALTGWPIPVWEVYNYTPQNTYAVGASIQLAYDYTIKDKLSIGLLAGYQYDTFGDAIQYISFILGRKF